MPAANTKHTWLAAIAASILRPLPDILRMPPVWEIAWKPVSEPFSENGFHQAGCQRKETGVPSFSSVQAVSNRRPDIVEVLSEARLAKHISSLRRTACRPRSVRLHAFHAALVVDRCGIFAVAVVGSCGIPAANIVDACGTVCGNGRGWLRRSCGKISSKPAASVVDQPLTDVRGQASPLFSWVLKRMRSHNQPRSLFAFRSGLLASSDACWNLCCRVLLSCVTGRVSCLCALRVRAAPLRLLAPSRPPINRLRSQPQVGRGVPAGS